jgi:cytoskeletal protein CcmA (bactofilin family)
MKTKRIPWLTAALVATCCIWLMSPGWALAAEVRSGGTAVVAPGETINDDLFVGGEQTVTIGGHVIGDAYAAGETVVVTGTIDGDLIAAAQLVTIDGTVAGNVRAAGATVTINGEVGHSVTGLAQHVNVSPNGRVGGSVLSAAQTIDAFGPVGRGITAFGGTLQLAGSVGGPVLARVETLTVAPTARVLGSLDYQAKQAAAVPESAVAGGVKFTPAPQNEPAPTPVLNGLFDLGGMIGLVASFLIGALAIVLMPRASARAAELGRQRPWQSFALGLIVLLGVPIASVVIGLTLVGLGVAVGLVALFVVSILVAWPAVGLVIGTQLTRLVSPRQPLHVLGTLAVGLIVLHLLTHIPYVGGLVAICVLIFGLGLVVQSLRQRRSADYAPTAPLQMAAA